MPCHLRRRPTQRSSTTPICPLGGDGTGRWRCRSSSTIPSIASSSLRALDSGPLATNVIVFMGGSTKAQNCGRISEFHKSCYFPPQKNLLSFCGLTKIFPSR